MMNKISFFLCSASLPLSQPIISLSSRPRCIHPTSFPLLISHFSLSFCLLLCLLSFPHFQPSSLAVNRISLVYKPPTPPHSNSPYLIMYDDDEEEEDQEDQEDEAINRTNDEDARKRKRRRTCRRKRRNRTTRTRRRKPWHDTPKEQGMRYKVEKTSLNCFLLTPTHSNSPFPYHV